jgi:hypothetical protein
MVSALVDLAKLNSWNLSMMSLLTDSFQGYIFDLFCTQERHGQFSSLMEQYQL